MKTGAHLRILACTEQSDGRVEGTLIQICKRDELKDLIAFGLVEILMTLGEMLINFMTAVLL